MIQCFTSALVLVFFTLLKLMRVEKHQFGLLKMMAIPYHCFCEMLQVDLMKRHEEVSKYYVEAFLK